MPKLLLEKLPAVFSFHTPVELHDCKGFTVFVKRDDLYLPRPGAPLAKIRGVAEHIAKKAKEGYTLFGTLDTRVSRNGWGVAHVCHELGLKALVGYGVSKNHPGKEVSQLQAEKLGAELLPIQAQRYQINYYQVRKVVRERGGYMLPNALVCDETAANVAKEFRQTVSPAVYKGGTVVCCVGSGMIMSGVLLGILSSGYLPKRIIGVMSGMTAGLPKTIYKFVPYSIPGFELVPSGMDYYTEYYPKSLPFPMHPNYDAKAWKWVEEHVGLTPAPVFFYNIGA